MPVTKESHRERILPGDSISTHDATRRRFLLAAILGTGAAAGGLSLSILATSKAWAETPDSEAARQQLAAMAKQLYPHDVDASVYADVMDSVLTAAASDPRLQQSLDLAISELNAATGGDFLAAGENLELVAMKGMEQEPWFAAIQGQVLPRVYNHPAIWKHIGYPGSSVEHGGYKDRGFNDIDWLPEDS